MIRVDRAIVAGNVIAFVATCVMAFALGWTPTDLVWGLCLSGTIAGALGILIPMYILLFIPALERKLFPDAERVEFSPLGRVFAAVFIGLILTGPFVGFMLAFTVFLAERLPLADTGGWWAHVVLALATYWPIVAIATATEGFESARRIFRGDGTAVLRPYGLVVKMFVIVFLSNFGFGAWSIVPLTAIMFVSEDLILQAGDKYPARA